MMKPIRYVLASALFTLSVFTAVVYTSCNKDKCGSTTCQNGGTCANSVCICPTGYSGKSCENGWSNASIGTYKCSRSNCAPAVAGGNSWISAVTKNTTNGGTINISNFDNSNVVVTATIDSAQNIIITPPAGTYGINAKGTYANGKIQLHFTTFSAGGGGYVCDMEMIKE